MAEAVPGAWVEEKPAGAVLHVREATPADGDAALAHAGVRLGERPGVFLIPGHRVLEATVRPTSKAAALMRLRAETGARSVLFAGDDVADEEVMASLGPLDLGVRVGPTRRGPGSGWPGRPTWWRCSRHWPRSSRPLVARPPSEPRRRPAPPLTATGTSSQSGQIGSSWSRAAVVRATMSPAGGAVAHTATSIVVVPTRAPATVASWSDWAAPSRRLGVRSSTSRSNQSSWRRPLAPRSDGVAW